MKRIVLINILFIMASVSGKAQGLALELSLNWKKAEVKFDLPPLKPDTTVYVPHLKLIYRNLTERRIYTKKLFQSNKIYPPVRLSSLINTEMDMAELAKLHFNYQEKFYNVEITDGWEVLKPGTDTSVERELDNINDELWQIHAVLETQQALNKLGIQKQLSIFSYADKEVVSYREAQGSIFVEKEKRELLKPMKYGFPNRHLTQDEISGKYADGFVFLKPGETFEEEVSLIGFYLLGGNYEFILPNDSMPNYVVSDNGKKLSLPKVVNGYQLYEGFFFKNMIGIEIKSP